MAVLHALKFIIIQWAKQFPGTLSVEGPQTQTGANIHGTQPLQWLHPAATGNLHGKHRWKDKLPRGCCSHSETSSYPQGFLS